MNTLRYISSLFLLILVSPMQANLIVNHFGKSAIGTISSLSGIDTVVIFDEIHNETQLTFTTNSSNDFSWSTFSETDGEVLIPSSVVSGVKSSSVKVNEGGYVMLMNGVKHYYYVVDYSKYQPLADTATVTLVDKGCSFNELNAVVSFPKIEVYSIKDNKKAELIPARTTYNWNATPSVNGFPVSSLSKTAIAPAPFEDVKYTFDLNRYFFNSGTTPFNTEGKSVNYKAIAVNFTSIVHKVNERSAENEKEKDKSGTASIEGSAPLDVSLSLEGVSKTVAYYDWTIWSNLEKSTGVITYRDKEARHTFFENVKNINTTNLVDYYVKITVSNNYCEKSDSVEVKLRTSELSAPNILVLGFNNRGTNDELQQFKVAYKSIQPGTFHCWITNRWGRKVYEFNDPSYGWDGKSGGKYVSPGVYYYVVKATGTDGRPYTLKGSLTILREKGL